MKSVCDPALLVITFFTAFLLIVPLFQVLIFFLLYGSFLEFFDRFCYLTSSTSTHTSITSTL